MKLDILLSDPDKQPDEAALSECLGPALAWFHGLEASCPDYEKSWRHYGRKYGWKYRAFDPAKTLYEVTPLKASLALTIAVRGPEWAILEALDLDPAAKAILAKAKAQDEGYGIKALVADEASFKASVLFIQALAEARLEQPPAWTSKE